MIIQCTREVADIQRRSTVNLWRWCACVSSGARPFPRSGPWIPGRVKVSHCFPRSTGVQAVYTCRNQCAGYLPQPVQATCRARCYKPESARAVPQATAGTLSKYQVPTTCVEHCDLSHLLITPTLHHTFTLFANCIHQTMQCKLPSEWTSYNAANSKVDYIQQH